MFEVALHVGPDTLATLHDLEEVLLAEYIQVRILAQACNSSLVLFKFSTYIIFT
jgi:hypothetical protein